MKKNLIKKIAMIGAVVVGMLAFGGITQANASSNFHFDHRTITYHIDSTSKRYKGIWKDAINEWNSKGVLKFKASSKKKADLRLDTRKNLKDDSFYTCPNPLVWGNILSGTSHVKLNRSLLDQGNYTRDERVNVATSAIETSLGVDNVDHNKSHMYDFNLSITSYDVAQLKKLYAHVK